MSDRRERYSIVCLPTSSLQAYIKQQQKGVSVRDMLILCMYMHFPFAVLLLFLFNLLDLSIDRTTDRYLGSKKHHP